MLDAGLRYKQLAFMLFCVSLLILLTHSRISFIDEDLLSSCEQFMFFGHYGPLPLLECSLYTWKTLFAGRLYCCIVFGSLHASELVISSNTVFSV